ncbi:kinase-like domain-containing protein, partial [Scheffersomyces coipomensis]|uniref:kinase-like domain-containing protein n=1 Tax=Scheffersomyces coipomensis TaxID=1788519 RepID=UPI00315CA18F
NEENEFDYKIGGYHPVSKGEIYYSKNFPNREYIILRKLGWGHFSTVWLAKSRFNPTLHITDTESSSEEIVDTSEYYVAIKFVKSNKNYLEAAEDEIKILKALHDPINFSHLSEHDKQYWQHIKPPMHPGYKHIMKLLDNFQIIGPNGNHICMVFEILGENVLNLIYKLLKKSRYSGGIPLNLVRLIVKQLFLALDYMHHSGIIHTDLKPENILIEIKEINKLIKIIELEKVSKLSSPMNPSISTGTNNSNPTSTSLSNSRNHSIASVNSVSSFHYKKSKNSVALGGTPIRSSKPLSSSMSQEVLFKDIDYHDHDNDVGVDQDHTPVFSNLNPDSIHQPDISIKIADLGNATFTNLHFTNQIQTRQYRSPEILLKYKSWGSSTDLWSVGCIIFELITGDYLFDPHDGQYFDKDEDHLAQIIELLGEFPSDEYLLDCKLTSKFFKLNPLNNEIIFKNIYNLKYWGLRDVLIEKYKFKKDDIQVKLISDLILKCLRFSLSDRYDAGSLLNHPWLQDDIKFDEIPFDDETIDGWLKNMENNNHHLPGFTKLSR